MAPAQRKRQNVTFRMRDELKKRLEEQAAKNERSLSEEIEAKLEQSFWLEGQFGSPRLRNMSYLMASAFQRGGERAAHAKGGPNLPEDRWLNDPSCYEEAVASVVEALREMRPLQGAERAAREERARAIFRELDKKAESGGDDE